MIGPLCSSKVIRSASTWQGCDSLVSPLITGTGGVRGQIQHHLVIEQADHHRVDIARDHARGVGDGFLAGKLHLAARQHDGGAAQLAHADVERNARAGGLLVEDHRQHAPFERAVGVGRAVRQTLAGLLAPARLGDQRVQRGGVEIGDVEEMLDGSHAASVFLEASKLFAAADSIAIASRTWASSMMSGGTSRTTFSPAPTSKQALLARGGDEFGVGHAQLEAEQQALAAHFLEYRRMLGKQTRKLLVQIIADPLHMRQEIRRQHQVEHGIADRHGERIAAIGRAVRARRHAFRRLGGGKTGAHRIAAADSLGDRHDVWRNAQPFIGEQFAGAPDAGLDLVEDQQQSVFVAELAQAAQEFRRQHAHPAFALDRLDQDRRGLRPDRRFHSFQIAGRDLIETVDLRAEALQIFRLTARGDCGQRAAVKGAFEGDDPEALGMAARQTGSGAPS